MEMYDEHANADAVQSRCNNNNAAKCQNAAQ